MSGRPSWRRSPARSGVERRKKPADEAKRDAHYGREVTDASAYEKRQAPGIDRAREDFPTELIRAEPVDAARRLQAS
jgi:hypothetical protein